MKFSSFQLTRYLFLLTTAVLAVLGTGSFLRINTNPARTVLYIFYASIMFVDAAAMLICFLLLKTKKQYVFYVSIFVLALNIFPTIFDQFGLADLLFVLLNIATLIALVQARKEFLLA